MDDIILFPHLPERLAGLEELAENLWWSWNPGARMLFKTLDRQGWKESGHNPDKMLRELPPEILEKAAADVDYLRQQIRDDGWQENLVEPINREAAPISKVMGKDGRQVFVKVPLTDPPIYVAVWKIAVGRVSLYLMDTDVEINDPWNRDITARLYIGDLEQRMRQEIVLGLGGAEVLKTLGIHHYLLHLNEGHAAFALLEHIRGHVQTGSEFAAACRKVIDSTIFTTHTPVPAGHDVFPFQLIEKYFHSYWPALGLDRDAFIKMGIHPEQPDTGFNMTAFALRLSGSRNGVSKRHAEVSRKMWRSLWPDVAEEQVPIDYITNGVHVPTWIEPKIKLLLDKYLGADWLDKHDDPATWQLLDNIPDTELWQTHRWLKVKLIDAVRELTRLRWADGGGSSSVLLAGGAFLDPSVLTFAFVEDYGEQLAQYLVHGVDVWLNNPLPPFEACGTSGMKAALNGVPHLSVVDGWWGEGFNGNNGWAVDHDANSENPDGNDAEKIYRLLEDQVIPLYYKMSENGIPLEWVRLMKAAIKSAAAVYSARRMAKQYIEFYSTSFQRVLKENDGPIQSEPHL